MIPRYSDPFMTQLWSEENKYQAWFRVELEVVQAYENAGEVASGTASAISEASKNIDWSRFLHEVNEKEKITKHDVIAFLSVLEDHIGDNSRYIHLGLTSSDVVDTAFALLLKESGLQVLRRARALSRVIREQAEAHKRILCLGRTHGQAAEITTFGLKLLNFYSELNRSVKRFEISVENISFGKLSGAVGNYSNISPKIEGAALESMGLKPEPIATQVIPRDRHAEFFSSLAIMSGFVERLSVEIRHLMRTEVGEVSEPFSKGQKGSSAMPHKKNPILTENLTGLARLIRSHAHAALENQALWHERDISHSSVERVIAPDATTLMDFALKRLNSVMTGLVVNSEKMRENLSYAGDLVYSQHVLSGLVKSGVLRQEAYAWVQESAFKTREGNAKFIDALCDNQKISEKLNKTELESLLSVEYHLRHLEEIYSRF